MMMVIIITIIIILFFGRWEGGGGGGGEVILDSNLMPVFGKPLLLQSCHISHSNKYLAHSTLIYLSSLLIGKDFLRAKDGQAQNWSQVCMYNYVSGCTKILPQIVP